jgi:two-component system, OmpR family, KDP operon response regulator KdpE
MLRIIEIGDFRIDGDTFRASIRNRKVRLTLKEFKLLVYLAKHPGRIIRHQKLVSAIWAADAAGQPERLRVLVGQVRKKIELKDAPHYIVTEPWIGYRFEPTGETSSFEFSQTRSNPKGA